MAKWLKATLFGRQLSHGSENESPQTFDEALQQSSPFDFGQTQDDPYLQQQQIPAPDQQQVPTQDPYLQEQMPFQAQQQIPTLQTNQAGSAGATPGGSAMKAAYDVSKQLVRDRMEAEDVEVLDSVKDTDIVCVRGTYDHIHLVLEAIKIPFSHVDPPALMRMELKPEQTIYVNCPSSFPKDAALKLEKFVSAGGQLITTDWALKHVLEVAFPRTVKYSGRSSGDEVVAVEIVDKEDEVLRGFIDQEKDAAPVWWLEGSSYPIQILDKKKVKVLVRSDELKRRYGHDPVIISFEWGKGIVYHMISHFYLQRSETRTKKQGSSSSNYAKAQGASNFTVNMFEKMEQETPGINYGMVQSAATSSEFVSRCLVRQKKKFTPVASQK